MTSPVQDYLVIEAGTGIAAAYCGRMLADAGVDVLKIESRGGDPLRAARPGGTFEPPGQPAALFRFLAGGKRNLCTDLTARTDRALLRSLLDRADAIVVTPENMAVRTSELDPGHLRDRYPGLVVLSITSFGLGSSWRGRPACDLTLQAWSGTMAKRGAASRPPVSAGGVVGEWAAGAFTAVAALIARRAARSTGAGQLVDVSMLECYASTFSMYPVTFAAVEGRPLTDRRTLNFPGVERTRDGWVGFMTATAEQWHAFCAMVGRNDWQQDPRLRHINDRLYMRDELVAGIRDWMLARDTAEILNLAAQLRIPAAPVGNGASVPALPHFAEREMYPPHPDASFRQPRPPYRFQPGPPTQAPAPVPVLGADIGWVREEVLRRPARRPPSGEPEHLPLAGVRVLDFTSFWAGPMVGHILGMFGADVVHVESTRRPDLIRFNSMRTRTDPNWWEWSGMFQSVNTNKRGLALDMSDPRGREAALRLVGHADGIVENYSPRVFENWGFEFAALAEIRPELILLRMPAFGLTGPWRDRTGYAQTQEQISGLAWVTGYPDEGPQVPNGPCDPIAGIHATFAFLLGLEYRDRTGFGTQIEAAMVDSALNVSAQQVVEFTAYGTLLERNGNRSTVMAPQGVYRCADEQEEGHEQWVALSVADDDQWRALRAVLGDPGWAAEPGLDTVTGRIAAHDLLDRHLSGWCRSLQPKEVVGTLWKAGVAVGTVTWEHQQDMLEPLRERGFFEPVNHPVAGSSPHGGFPARLEFAPRPLHRRPAPTLGEHNLEILSEWGGLTLRQIAELARAGVIGTTYAEPGRSLSRRACHGPRL